MKGFITSKPGRRWGQVLVVLVLATAGLILLLATWDGLPAAEARGPVTSNTGSADPTLSSSDAITHFIFLPLISKSNIVFFDDFSSTSSGWPHKVSFEDCYYEYHNGHYRVEVSAYGQRCIIPNLKIPKQVNGTFSVRARRTSDEDEPLLYGLIFGAGPDANEDRWALEIYPNEDENCSNKPFFWLVALVDGDTEYFESRCTDAIVEDEDEWNDLKIIRNGKSIKVYINGKLKGDYSDANYLLNQGYSLLEVVAVSDETIYVEFDDFTILPSTSAP
jgi:hypothetical protein